MTYTSNSEYPTAKASQYLQQLCKHFAHKVPAEFDANTGKVSFPGGRADISADNEMIRFMLNADSKESLNRIEIIVEDHFVRFAHREKVAGLTWS